MTVFSAYNDLKNKLKAAAVEDYVFEAKQIIKRITGFNNREILEHYNDPLSDFQLNNLQVILRQREIHYPLQYALGSWNCFGYEFKVGPGVLIPRADTETVIETAKEVVKDKKLPLILDLCTGTGCIGISLAKEFPQSTVSLVEKYPEAGVYAQENITLNRAFNATLFMGDVFLGALSDKKYDLIVSNPPYISEGDMENLQTEVTFEPETALKGGKDGLDFYRVITQKYKDSLKNGGVLMFEIGAEQGDSVKNIMEQNGFLNVEVKTDIENRDRVVFGTVKIIE